MRPRCRSNVLKNIVFGVASHGSITEVNRIKWGVFEGVVFRRKCAGSIEDRKGTYGLIAASVERVIFERKTSTAGGLLYWHDAVRPDQKVAVLDDGVACAGFDINTIAPVQGKVIAA